MEFSHILMSWIAPMLLIAIWVMVLVLVIFFAIKLSKHVGRDKAPVALHGELITLTEKLLKEQKRSNELLEAIVEKKSSKS